MRVIAGKHRGRRLVAADESITRPTTDRVKESMMSALISRKGSLEGSVVLDLFAGSGALGIEAMSRGASFACLVDANPKAVSACAQNVKTLGFGDDEVRILKADSFKTAFPRKGFDIVFLDPPYEMRSALVEELLDKLCHDGVIANDATIIYEHSEKGKGERSVELHIPGFELVSSRTLGHISFDIYQGASL